jgi:hypothetical protein
MDGGGIAGREGVVILIDATAADAERYANQHSLSVLDQQHSVFLFHVSDERDLLPSE